LSRWSNQFSTGLPAREQGRVHLGTDDFRKIGDFSVDFGPRASSSMCLAAVRHRVNPMAFCQKMVAGEAADAGRA
jgi:hypothetical protein